jgi:hypothetical protein
MNMTALTWFELYLEYGSLTVGQQLIVTVITTRFVVTILGEESVTIVLHDKKLTVVFLHEARNGKFKLFHLGMFIPLTRE